VGSEIYFFGGEEDGEKQASVFKYGTVADKWSTLAPIPQACAYHSASVLDGMVCIVCAGSNSSKVLRFDPATGVWSTLASTLNGRMCGASFVLGGCFYTAGGAGSQSSVERYDVATNTRMAAADMLLERYCFCAVTVGFAGSAEEQDLFDSLIAKATSGRP
jgi:hypothetical protein